MSFLFPPITEDAVFVGEGLQEFSALGIRVKGKLDRESRDRYEFHVTCELVHESGSTTVLSTPGTLYVLDQNDNPPMTQDGLQHETVYINMKSEKNHFVPVKYFPFSFKYPSTYIVYSKSLLYTVMYHIHT